MSKAQQPTHNERPNVSEQETRAERFKAARLTAEQRESLIQVLKSPDRPSFAQLAEQYRTSVNKVHRLALQIESPGESATALYRLKQYRRLGKRLPVKERVDIYATIARGKASERAANAQLAALGRIEALEGIVTAKERREGADNSGGNTPMFVLPQGSRIAVAVVTPADSNQADDEGAGGQGVTSSDKP